MKRMTKAICPVMTLLTIIVMSVGTNAVAGGGANWKVTISNPTEYGIEAVVCCQIAPGGTGACVKCDGEHVWIGAGQSVVVETGATCPCAVYGWIHVKGEKNRIAEINLGTGKSNSCCSVCKGTAACWNSSITVKKITPPACDPNENYAFTK